MAIRVTGRALEKTVRGPALRASGPDQRLRVEDIVYRHGSIDREAILGDNPALDDRTPISP